MYRVEIARDFGFVYTYESIEEALKGVTALLIDGHAEDEISLMQEIPFKVEVKAVLP